MGRDPERWRPAVAVLRRPKAKKPEPVALVDMDGTTADFEKAMEAAIEALLGADNAENSLWRTLSEDTKDRIRLLIKQQPGFWLNLEPMRLGLKIVVELQKLGFKLTVLSKGPTRSTNAWTEKVQWCAKWLPFADVCIVQDKGLVYGRVLVDDFPDYILRWLDWRPRGIVIMPGNPSNADFRHPQVHRVETDQDVERLRPILKRAINR